MGHLYPGFFVGAADALSFDLRPQHPDFSVPLISTVDPLISTADLSIATVDPLLSAADLSISIVGYSNADHLD